MNNVRILRLTNALLMLIGYQVHHFDAKSQRFRLSIWMIGHFFLISLGYLMAFSHHFEQSAILHLLQDVSPFLKRLVRLQLLMGLKIYLFGIYELRIVTRAANELVTILPKVFAKKFSREEAYAYFLNYSTLSISAIIILYVAYEMNFELPPLDNILIFCGLCIPHFMLGGALKLYNIGTWFQREQLLELQEDLQRIAPTEVDENTDKTFIMLESGNKLKEPNFNVTNTFSNNPEDLAVPLQQIYKQLTQLSKTAAIFNAALKRQLTLLVLLNCNCLLAGTYSRVYYQSTWQLVLMKRTRHIFQATNCGIFILIFWDYLTLCITQYLFENVRQNFIKRVYKNMKQRQRFNETTRYIFTDMHELLNKGFRFKILDLFYMNLASFLLLQVFVGLIIALIVVYHYLNDQIFALSERFDDNDTDDD